MDDFPLTASQRLAQLRGYEPNDGAPEITFARGDRNAMAEDFVPRRSIADQVAAEIAKWPTDEELERKRTALAAAWGQE